MFIAATDGTFQLVNQTLGGWLGYEPSELVGKKRFPDILSAGGRVFHQTHLLPLLVVQGSISEVKLDVRHRDGTSIPVLINAVRHIQEDVTYDEFAVFIATDRHKYEKELVNARAQLREANQQLFETSRRKDEFLATLAHELRNPLAPMKSTVEVLKLKPPVDEQTARCLTILTRQIGQMTHLVDDLMEATRVSQGKIDLRKEFVSLSALVNTVVEATRPIIKAGHLITVTLPEEDLLIEADPTRLTQILQNLLTNAAKYTLPGGKIWLSASVEESQVLFQIADSGIGLAAEDLPRIFEMFSQVQSAKQRSQGGLGIGLALVKGLVELHGGQIRAESGGLGKGSRFSFNLPLPLVRNLPTADQSVTIQESHDKRRVLVIDDNLDAAESLGAYLDILGHEVAIAHDGVRGLQLAKEFLPDVILLDIGLPGADGYEVARRIRKEEFGRNVTLIAVTGWGQAQDKQAAFEAGFNRHCTKPIDHKVLNEILQSSAKF